MQCSYGYKIQYELKLKAKKGKEVDECLKMFLAHLSASFLSSLLV